MKSSIRLCLALPLCSSLFACAGASSPGAVSPADDSVWRPGAETELSIGSRSTAAPASAREAAPAPLHPNHHEIVRGRLYSSR